MFTRETTDTVDDKIRPMSITCNVKLSQVVVFVVENRTSPLQSEHVTPVSLEVQDQNKVVGRLSMIHVQDSLVLRPEVWFDLDFLEYLLTLPETEIILGFLRGRGSDSPNLP